jgi:putative oxidoreductase
MKHIILKCIIFLLIMLWVYAALSKLLDFERGRSQMLNQVFPSRLGNILVWAVPIVELLTAGLLTIKRTALAGLYSSLFLLAAFSLYIGLVMTNVFGRIPCSCGGILEKMSWGQHLVFNLVFLLLTIVAVLFRRDQSSSYKPGAMNSPHQKGGAMGKGF